MKKIFILASLIFLVFQANGGLLGPSNYEDCVLENIKDAKTELGIQTVYMMCREKFSEKNTKKNKEEIPQTCLLFWNGLKTTILQSEPREWRKNYAQYAIERYGMTVAKVFVPKAFELNKESESLMYREVQIYCK